MDNQEILITGIRQYSSTVKSTGEVKEGVVIYFQIPNVSGDVVNRNNVQTKTVFGQGTREDDFWTPVDSDLAKKMMAADYSEPFFAIPVHTYDRQRGYSRLTDITF